MAKKLRTLNLFIIRHAQAMDRSVSEKRGIDEGDRPLTLLGRKRFQKTLTHLKSLDLQIHLCFVSPWLRAQQTAECLSGQMDVRKMITVDWLLPDTPFSKTHKSLVAAVSRISKPPQNVTIALIGHEPHLSSCLVSYLRLPVPWEEESFPEDAHFIKLKKGSVAELEFASSSPRIGAGMLKRLTY